MNRRQVATYGLVGLALGATLQIGVLLGTNGDRISRVAERVSNKVVNVIRTPTPTPTETPTPTNTPAPTATPLPTATPTPVTRSLNDKISVAAGRYVFYSINLRAKDVLSGWWSSRSGGDLDFYIESPNGDMVYSAARSYGSDVKVIVPTTGTYRLTFRAPGLFTNKVVEFWFSYPGRD